MSLTSNEHGNVTFWQDGSSLLYQNWALGQRPDMVPDLDRKAAVLSPDGQWRWAGQEEEKAAVCKKDASKTRLQKKSCDYMFARAACQPGTMSKVGKKVLSGIGYS